jgi:hypothetical protein
MRWTAALSKFMSLRQDTIAALRAQVDGLQKKIAKLEKQEGAPSRPFAFDAYPQRKIALLFRSALRVLAVKAPECSCKATKDGTTAGWPFKMHPLPYLLSSKRS